MGLVAFGRKPPMLLLCRTGHMEPKWWTKGNTKIGIVLSVLFLISFQQFHRSNIMIKYMGFTSFAEGHVNSRFHFENAWNSTGPVTAEWGALSQGGAVCRGCLCPGVTSRKSAFNRVKWLLSLDHTLSAQWPMFGTSVHQSSVANSQTSLPGRSGGLVRPVHWERVVKRLTQCKSSVYIVSAFLVVSRAFKIQANALYLKMCL
jgi:hypothetical protein